VYLIYSNMLALGQTLLQKGVIPWPVGLWWVHGLMLAAALYLFRRRALNRPLFRWGR
jgi:lipopolysaccharide export system permease protein